MRYDIAPLPRGSDCALMTTAASARRTGRRLHGRRLANLSLILLVAFLEYPVHFGDCLVPGVFGSRSSRPGSADGNNNSPAPPGKLPRNWLPVPTNLPSPAPSGGRGDRLRLQFPRLDKEPL